MTTLTAGLSPVLAPAFAPSVLPDLATTRFKRRLDIAFSGSGSEYFRIWIVNLLLIVVTLGLYLPFAKARRLRYFYANTQIDGQALAFHGQPWRMFRGFALLAVLMTAYAVAGRLSPLAGLIAFGLLCAAWPALWRAGLQFRLSNTSWRGLRLGFRGDLAGAYRCMLPTYLPAIAMVVCQFLWAPRGRQQPDDPAFYALVTFGPLLLLCALLPWGLALLKRYQHGGYVFADQQTRLSASTASFYGLGLKGLLLSLVPVILAGIVAAVLMPLLRSGLLGQAGALIAIGGLALLAYLMFFVTLMSYFSARLQNLVWCKTASASLQFDSQLSARTLAWLNLKNWVLTAVTLGLYRPFAAVNILQLRLQALTVTVDADIDSWVAEAGTVQQDAAGDAAGDFFGIDMGL
nr:YjgN family protein [uncultured Roseateles sp.]